MKKFSINIEKHYTGLRINSDISFDTKVIESFNENSIIGNFECKSILITNSSNGITANINCNCSYIEDTYIYTIRNKIITLVEVNLFQAILITCGNQIREKASAIYLFDEPRIINLEAFDECEINKINGIIGSCFGYSAYLKTELLELNPISIENNLISSLNLIGKVDSENKGLINQSIVYLSMVEHQGKESGLVPQDFIQKFILAWSSFNSIYQIYEQNADKKGVEAYAKKLHVVKCFESNYTKIRQYIIELSTKNLVDKKGVDCSNELKNALAINDFENISLWTLICIYIIRNTVFHGKIEKNNESGLCRIATLILLPIVHSSILEEIKAL